MKNYHRLFFIILFYIFNIQNISYAISAYADIEAIGGKIKSIENADKINIKEIANNPGLLSMMYLNTDRTMLVLFSKEKDEDDISFVRMTIFQGYGNDFVKKYEYDTADSYCTSYTDIYKNRIFSVWSGGSAYRLIIFNYKKEKIDLVFAKSWKNEPELVHLYGSDELDIVLPSNWDASKGAKTAEIYRWDGDNYVIFKTLPWKKRFLEGR